MKDFKRLTFFAVVVFLASILTLHGQISPLEDLKNEMSAMRNDVNRVINGGHTLLHEKAKVPAISIKNGEGSLQIKVEGIETDNIKSETKKSSINIVTDQGKIHIQTDPGSVKAQFRQEIKRKEKTKNGISNHVSITDFQTSRTIEKPLNLKKAQVTFNDQVVDITIPFKRSE